MTTVNQQKEMFYNASRQAVIKQLLSRWAII